MDILKRIDELRIEKGWSIYRLAEESSITQSTLANMFARKTSPSISTLTSICNGLGIGLAEFFTEKEKDSKEAFDIVTEFNKLKPKDKDAVINLIKNLQ